MIRKKILLKPIQWVLMILLFAQTQAWAVYLDSNGTGQALIFPYYTVKNGHNTIFTIKNNRDRPKAIKVDFRESYNGATVLNLNLYLDAYDEWSGALVASISGAAGHIGEPSVSLVTQDTSCTPFVANPQPFLPFVYELDAGPDSMERVQTGFIQVTEMGELGGVTFPNAVEHVGGVPANCSVFESAWAPGGVWLNDPTTDMLPATGGLSGYFSIIEVPEGYGSGESAQAIGDFYPEGELLHTAVGDVDAGLSASEDSSRILIPHQTYQHLWSEGFETLSASFMRELVYLDFELFPVIGGVTESVLTFPTKSLYVNDVQEAIQPFTTLFAANGACETVSAQVTSQDQNTSTEQLPIQDISLCQSVNVIGYRYDSNEPTPLITDAYQAVLDVSDYNRGTTVLNFSGFQTNQAFDENIENFRYLYFGLPVLSFNFQRYTNFNATNGPVLYAVQKGVASEPRVIPETVFFSGFDN